MTIDTNKLRELATAASGGEWLDDDGTHEVRAGENCEYYVPEKANRAFIAAANPKAVLELLDDADQLRKACATWQSIFTGFPHDAQQALRDMRERLAAMTKARDEACDQWEAWMHAEHYRGPAPQEDRLAELRKVGAAEKPACRECGMNLNCKLGCSTQSYPFFKVGEL